MHSSLTPNPLLLAYYGDDFTGSTDALESLARAGLRTVLFLQPPTPEQLASFPGLRAFGISGGSRIMTPAEMENELPQVFEALQRSGAPIVHYKTCSTFDSAPAIGSIGKAIELGRRVFGERLTPLVVGFPAFGRHVVFGNLFARSGDSEPLRLDRHPMSRHPVTPMHEADLRLHLAGQTGLPVELVDVLKLKGWQQGVLNEGGATPASRQRGAARRYESLQKVLDAARIAKPPPIVLFDTLDDDDLPVIGRLISSQVHLGGQVFCAGSSGVDYALVAHWRQAGLLPFLQNERHRHRPICTPSDPKQTIIVSGSCSPNTDRQIGRALEAGFAEVACDSGKLADVDEAQSAVSDAVVRAMPALRAGRHVIFHSARGTTDPRRAAVEGAAGISSGGGMTPNLAAARARLGHNLGRVLLASLGATGARRAVICGGDTATQAGRALGIVALEFLAPFVIGAPLCRVHAPGSAIDGCELVCKGGQMGPDSFFLDLVSGVSAEPDHSSHKSRFEVRKPNALLVNLSYEPDEALSE